MRSPYLFIFTYFGFFTLTYLIGVGDIINRSDVLSSRPDESSDGVFGEVKVNCNTSGVISVSQPTAVSTDAQALTLTASNAFVSTDGADSSSFVNNIIASSDGNQTGSITPNGTEQTLFVHLGAIDDAAIPDGEYTFRTIVTVTPQ